jgi:hypothetical protein
MRFNVAPIESPHLSFALKMLNSLGMVLIFARWEKIKGVHIETGGLIYEGEKSPQI